MGLIFTIGERIGADWDKVTTVWSPRYSVGESDHNGTAQGQRMEIGTREIQDVTIIDMSGELISQTSGDAYDEMVRIAKSGVAKVVLNLDKLDYLSSAGLRVILTAAKLLKSSSGEMIICNANGVVKEVLESSGFNSLVDMYDTESDAVSKFAS